MSRDMTPLPTALRHSWHYVLALLLVAIGVMLRVMLTALVGPALPTYLTFYPSVILAALIGGVGPGLLATLATMLVADYWLLPPVASFKVESFEDLIGVVFFCFMGVFMSLVAGLYRRMRDHLEELVILRTSSLSQANEKLLAQGEELRLSERESRGRAARLHATLDAAPWIILTAHDRECSRITGNRAAERFFRVPEGTNMSKTSPEADRLAHFRVFKDGVELRPDQLPIISVASSGKPLLDYTIDFAFNDGTTHSLLGNLVPVVDEEGHPSGAIAAYFDITERKRVEEALRESEWRSKRAAEVNRTMAELGRIINSTLSIDEVYEQFVQLVKNLVPFDRLLVSIIDPKRETCSIAHCSGFKMPGRERGDTMPLPRTVAEVERKGSGMLLEADEEKGFPEEYPSLSAPFRAGIRSTIIVPLISKGVVIGALFFGSVRSKAYKEDDLTLAEDVARQISGAIANAQLLIEYKRSEEALRRSRDELETRVRERTADLERRNQALQEFVFVASHDLSEPLRKIQAFGSLLEQRCDDLLGEEERDFISRMTGSAGRMRELLNALLTYSRVDTKSQEFRAINLDDIVREVVSDLEVTIGKIGARVEIGPLCSVTGDPLQLRQLFQNLISNSLKYYRSEVKPLVGVHTEEEDSARRIFVEDNGIGFDEKYLDKIFQPFQRLHGRNEYPGIGMGLAICRKIVERHHGTIAAKSTPGRGSTFIVTLPVSPEKS